MGTTQGLTGLDDNFIQHFMNSLLNQSSLGGRETPGRLLNRARISGVDLMGHQVGVTHRFSYHAEAILILPQHGAHVGRLWWSQALRTQSIPPGVPEPGVCRWVGSSHTHRFPGLAVRAVGHVPSVAVWGGQQLRWLTIVQ